MIQNTSNRLSMSCNSWLLFVFNFYLVENFAVFTHRTDETMIYDSQFMRLI